MGMRGTMESTGGIQDIFMHFVGGSIVKEALVW